MSKEPPIVEETKKNITEEVELTAYEAMDMADEAQIIDEIEGKIDPNDLETLVYSFTDKTTGKEITGLSWRGTKATWWEFNKTGLTDMTVTDHMNITQGDGYVDVAVYAFDNKRKIGAWGMARGYTSQQTRNGAIVDRFASAKAMSKAQRNALNQLFPMEMVAKLIKQWMKGGKGKILTPQVIAQTRITVNQNSQVTNMYPTQNELLMKYKMNVNQIPPKCPNCGEIMYLQSRKDGSGVFWSCKNWKTKGCKGYNVDEVDIDGTITMKNNNPYKKTYGDNKNNNDMPF